MTEKTNVEWANILRNNGNYWDESQALQVIEDIKADGVKEFIQNQDAVLADALRQLLDASVLASHPLVKVENDAITK